MAFSPTPSTSDPGPPPVLRSVLSLLLVIHLICVFVVLSSTYIRSQLQSRLVGIFGPYTELLVFDPGQYTPFYYTHGTEEDEDATLVIDLYPDGDLPVARQQLLRKVTLPEGGSAWLGDRSRAIALAKHLAREAEDDDLSAQIARPVGARIMRENGARRAVVRCVRRLSQPLRLDTLFREFPADDPSAPAYDRVLYEADVWIDEDGQPQVLRRVAAAEAAPRRTAPRQGSEDRGQGTRDREQGAPQ